MSTDAVQMLLTRIERAESRLAVLEKSADGQAGQKDRIIVLEQSLGTIKEDLADIKAMLREQKGSGK